MTMSCPEVMYGAYYPYLYGRAAASSGRTSTFASPFTAHQYDRASQTLPQELYGASTTLAAQSSIAHSSGGSVSSGGANSPGSPPHNTTTSFPVKLHTATKEEDLSGQGRSSTEGQTAAASSDSESESGVVTSAARAQYVSANCVVFTHYSGDVASVVDEHFTRALSYADKGNKDSSPMSSRNFPPSFWNSQWQGTPSTSMTAMGMASDLYGDPYHSHDPWTQHYQQYTAAAAHHHRAVHDYHAHHTNMAQYGSLFLPPARLPHHSQYGKSAVDWSATHTPSFPHRLHHEQTGGHHSSHTLETTPYSSYPTMSGLEAQVQESSKDLYWF